MPRPPFPKTLREFQSKFASDEACQAYLAACRWPDGFVCPRCGNRRAYELVKLRRWQCAGCRRQTSVTAGTILNNTKTPLTVWFWAAYSMTTDKRGISALQKQRRNSTLVGGHRVRGPEPNGQRCFRVIENRASRYRSLVPATGTLPTPEFDQFIGAPISAPGAHEAVRPAAGRQVSLASLITGKLRLKLA